MKDDIELIKNRFRELAKRSFDRGIWTESEFLSLAEQDVLLSLNLREPFELEGGFAAAERRLAHFGSPEICGYEEPAPIACLLIEPVSEKFGEELSHRDYLGSLMALGIRREVMGDIAVTGKRAWLFCLDSIGDYIAENLTQVRKTSVKVSRTEPPELLIAEPPVSEAVVASERLDALISAVYKLSRSKSAQEIGAGLVYLNGRLCLSPDKLPEDGTLISVRGTGRFRYEGIARETKKGRLRVMFRKYS